jgi:hypothetical protein
MSDFTALRRRADTLRRIETDAVREAWFAGYNRGLRYAHFQTLGQTFGTLAEHELFLSAADSIDLPRAALGRGYRAGLTLTWVNPS